ncbi:MAG: hypothetical protein CMO01_10105 [Thalassobius sp.]|nr:hypothetical protein [Thalassovita sp.]
MKKLLAFLLCICLSSIVYSQKAQIQLGTQVPLNYAAGLEFFANKNLSLNMQVGYLTKPYDEVILEILKKLGTEEAIVYTIGNSNPHGIILQPTLKFHLGTIYAGLTYSYYNLKANDVPSDAIEYYYDVNIPNRYDRILNLESNLHNAGLLIGKEITFGQNDKSGLKFELSVQKTFASSSNLYANESIDLSRLNTLVTEELNHYYVDYGYLPSFNIFYFYNF